MRILYLANPGPDYLQDAVFHGLVQILGAENVVDLPVNPQYHGARPDGRFAMLGFDIPARGVTTLQTALHDADGVVIGSLRDEIRPLVAEALASRALPPTVFLDGEDDPYVRGIHRFVDHYCKREMLLRAPRLRARMPARRAFHALRRRPAWADPLTREISVATSSTRGIEPLPFGIIDVGVAPSPEKDYDVAFAGSTRNPSRAAVSEMVDRLKRDGYRVFTTDTPVPWTEYLDALRRSQIGVAARGLGYDTYRYWEVPYAGALLVSEHPQTVIPHNFVHGEEAVFVRSNEMEAAVREWVQRDDAADVARAGREKVLKHHTSVQRAERVIELIGSGGRRRRRRGR